MVLVGTLLTHLGGGSAGREGTAIQLSTSLADGLLSRALRLRGDDRRLVLVAAIAGGFGAVFGVPLAGCVFALEVLAIGLVSYEALVPALAASVTGDQLVRALGVHHTAYPQLGAHVTPVLLLEVAAAGVAFGLVGTLFAEAVHLVKAAWAALVPWPPARPLLGGCTVVAAVLVLGARAEEGLSIPLITRSLGGGAGVPATAWLLKLVLTALTLGAGFQGGEVTPLFVIGATLGAAIGHLFGIPVPVLAAVGFVAVFAGATNTPLACTVMGVELFGRGLVVPLAVGCVVAYACSSHAGIYAAQRVGVAKGRLGGAGTPPA
jgi:H+/Cl- antiporter ClcA